MTLTQHPLSAAFPAMGAEEFQALKDSIESIGIQSPITLMDGQVIDGWHRYAAALELGIECPTVELGDVDPRDFVLAQNKARRHITQAQLAMATTAVFAWLPHGDPRSAPGADRAKSAQELAEAAGVGVRTIEQAKAVQTKAAPEVADAVKRGEIGLKKAAAIAQLPKEQQAEAMSKPLAAIKPQPAGKPAPTPDPIAEEAYGDTDLSQIVDELQRDLEIAERKVADWEKMMQADGREMLAKAIRRYEHAERRQQELMGTASDAARQRDRYAQQLSACGKAVGELDLDKVVRAVQSFARAAKAEQSEA